MAYVVPADAICAASIATDPLPAPISQTVLRGPRSSSARAIDAHFAGRQQALLGPRLQKRLVGIAEQPAANRLGGPIGHVRLADQDHHVERRELHLRQLVQLALRHALVGRAEVLADIAREIIDSLIQQRLGNRAGGDSSLVNSPTFSAMRILSRMLASGAMRDRLVR